MLRLGASSDIWREGRIEERDVQTSDRRNGTDRPIATKCNRERPAANGDRERCIKIQVFVKTNSSVSCACEYDKDVLRPQGNLVSVRELASQTTHLPTYRVSAEPGPNDNSRDSDKEDFRLRTTESRG